MPDRTDNVHCMSHPAARPYVWMLSGSFSFSLMALLASNLTQITQQCDWQTVAVFRSSLVAIFAAILAVLGGAKLVFWPWRLWVRSVAGSCSMICTFYAFGHLPVADVVTLTNTFPIWIALLSWPLYGRFPGPKVMIAILMGVVGVALVEQPHFATGNWGVATALAAAAFTAVAMLGLHSLKGIDSRAVVVHFSAVATVFCTGAFLVGPLEHNPVTVLDGAIPLKLLALGVTALVGQLFLTLAFRTGAPAKVSVVGLTQIVFTLLFSALFFDHEMDSLTLTGTALVIAPTAWLLLQSRPGVEGEGDAGEPSAAESQVGGPA